VVEAVMDQAEAVTNQAKSGMDQADAVIEQAEVAVDQMVGMVQEAPMQDRNVEATMPFLKC
jgi:hypothetical protein